ncbi:MAG: PEFG-CTERM sorting domain-containing protein [Nitrosarchaeum sp.]|uniref:PEFG-CTERM sorting domain-containing protein n=1 Tax=Nitrosarchaeum sp. TaxID=2026886 RepID=UPI002DEA312B|nr:PEFG-CTERM sorting domain-containing protein [Nitrosarchaeum sp.]
MIFSTPALAQTLESDSFSNPSEYVLEIGEHEYSISYTVNANVIAMAIDPESKSLLIGLDKTYDSQFFIGLEHDLINAENNDFIILVDGEEVDYQITFDSERSAFEFFVPVGSEEVEIIGTHVIPEFPIGAVFGFIVMISFVMLFAKMKPSFFKL